MTQYNLHSSREDKLRDGHLFAAGEPLSFMRLSDRRTFPELLSVWAKHEACSGQAFLEKTGLSEILSAEDFHEMELGRKIPGERMMRVMAIHLPSGILRKEESPCAQLHYIQFVNKAEQWRRKNRSLPIIDLSENTRKEFCLRKMDALTPTTSQETGATQNEPRLAAGRDMDQIILRHMSDIATQQHAKCLPEEIKEILAAQYRQNPHETLHGLHAFFKRTYTQKELQTWLENLNKPHTSSPSGNILCLLLQSKGITQESLAEKVHTTQSLVSNWCSGTRIIPTAKAGIIASSLDVSAQEAEQFICLVNPGITAHVGKQWLKEKIAQGKWNIIDNPALDATWLAAQPAKKQPGLFLQTHMDIKSLRQRSFADAVGTVQSNIVKWRTGDYRIPHHKAGTIANALSLTAGEAEQFIRLVNPHIIAHTGEQWLKDIIVQGKWEIIDNPAFDAQWLAAQPVKKQPGLLLLAYTNRKGISQDALSKGLGIDRRYGNHWCDGTFQIPSDALQQIKHELTLTAAETTHLKTLIDAAGTSKTRYADHVFSRALQRNVRKL